MEKDDQKIYLLGEIQPRPKMGNAVQEKHWSFEIVFVNGFVHDGRLAYTFSGRLMVVRIWIILAILSLEKN